MGYLNDHPVLTAIVVVVGGWLAKAIFDLAVHRRGFRDLPGPPHHWIFGHLIEIGEVVKKIPKRIHPHVHPYFLTEKYNLPPVFYVDLRPVTTPLLVIMDPDVAQEVAFNSHLPKDSSVGLYVKPLAGPGNMLITEGRTWKKWRSVFNPGFSVQHLMSQVPLIVNCTETYIDVLNKHAEKNHVFRIEEEATKVTIDVIGKVVCDHEFNSLTTENEFVEYLRKILAWMPDFQSINPFHTNNPMRFVFMKYYKWQMDRYISRILDERFAKRGPSDGKRRKVGIDLALEEYAKEEKKNGGDPTTAMNAEFRRFATDNLLILLVEGHDTTASTVCFAYHLLNKHPEKLARIRQELDEVFGVGVSAGDQIRNDPYIINKCEYTLAVIKEVLRLWPPASTVRQGRKGYFIEDPITGDMLPTEGMRIWISSICMHRDARLWPDPVNDFIPERFLPANADKLTPNAWRPFEKGPRNCIGQELALIELKVILAMTVREFDISTALEELGSLEGDGSVWSQTSSTKDGPQEIWGESLYQVLLAAGKPRDGMPCRIKKRDMSGAKQ